MTGETYFNGKFYQWGARIEWTPAIPMTQTYSFILSADLRTVFELAEVISPSVEASPFVRVACDQCGKLSSRIRRGYFEWPWTGELWKNSAGRWAYRGQFIREALASIDSAYCPSCYFKMMAENKRAWDCDKTKRFIRTVQKEIKNADKNNRSTQAVSGGLVDCGQGRQDGSRQGPQHYENCGADK